MRTHTRRQFLAAGAVLVAGAVAGCAGGGGGGGSGKSAAKTNAVTVFRLSGRGRRISRAAKLHNANKLFKTKKLADKNRAHPGDPSRIVAVTISQAEFDRLFRIPRNKIVDRRHKV